MRVSWRARLNIQLSACCSEQSECHYSGPHDYTGSLIIVSIKYLSFTLYQSILNQMDFKSGGSELSSKFKYKFIMLKKYETTDSSQLKNVFTLIAVTYIRNADRIWIFVPDGCRHWKPEHS